MPFWRLWGPIGRPLAVQRAHVSLFLNFGSLLVSILGPFLYIKRSTNPHIFSIIFLIDFGTIFDDFEGASVHLLHIWLDGEFSVEARIRLARPNFDQLLPGDSNLSKLLPTELNTKKKRKTTSNTCWVSRFLDNFLSICLV